MRHCQYCDALNPDDALHCNAETVGNRFRLPENFGIFEHQRRRNCNWCCLCAHFAAACLSKYDCLACVRGIVPKCKRCSLLSVSTE